MTLCSLFFFPLSFQSARRADAVFFAPDWGNHGAAASSGGIEGFGSISGFQPAAAQVFESRNLSASGLIPACALNLNPDGAAPFCIVKAGRGEPTISTPCL